jgi:MFS family permease
MSLDAVPDARRAGTTQGLTLLLPVTLTVMGVLVLAPVVPRMIAHFSNVPGASFWIPALLTVPGLCIALFSALAGWLGDRFGRRRLLIIFVFVYAVAGIAPILLNDITAIFVTRIAVGICEAFVLTLSTALIGDFFYGREREKWLAAQTAVASMSAVLLLVLGGLLGNLFGWRGPFAVYALTAGLGAALIRNTWEPGRARGPAAASSHGGRFPFRVMTGICAVTIIASVLFYTTQVQMSTALAALGAGDPASAGLWTALASIGVPFGTVIFWRCAAHPVSRLLVVEFTILGATFAAMSHAGSVPAFVAASALNQIGAGMVLPTLLTWAVRQLPFAMRGRGTGLWQSVFASGQFVSGLAVPAIAQHAGGIVAAFQYLAVPALAAAVLAAIVPAGVTHNETTAGDGDGAYGFTQRARHASGLEP